MEDAALRLMELMAENPELSEDVESAIAQLFGDDDESD